MEDSYMEGNYISEKRRKEQFHEEVLKEAWRLAEEKRKKREREKGFGPITLDEVLEVLDLTIKKDDSNKVMVFLGMLSAYTEESQINITLNAPSSTGKTYIPKQVVQLFPREDVRIKGYCSPTAFFHEEGEYDQDRKATIVDLSRKIIIFEDQPNPALLERLRPLLSHDSKEMNVSITDKKKGSGNRTKKVIIKGYPAVTFCSADLKMDEQECTRFMMLSPEIDAEKIRLGIIEKVKAEKDPEEYRRRLEANPKRQSLKERIRAIKEANIRNIKISNPKMLQDEFFKQNQNLKARHQRDISRLIALTKASALLNLWHRERKGTDIVASEEDFYVAWNLWLELSKSQDLNLPPYVYAIYEEVIVPAFIEKGTGLKRTDIIKRYNEVNGHKIQDKYLRDQVLKTLYSAGLIFYEKDPEDHRRNLIFVPDSRVDMEGNPGDNEDHPPREIYFEDYKNIEFGVSPEEIDAENIDSGVDAPPVTDNSIPF